MNPPENGHSATISPVSDLASDYRCRDFVRMSIGDALTNIIPVFIQSEATAGRGVYFGGSDFACK